MTSTTEQFLKSKFLTSLTQIFVSVGYPFGGIQVVAVCR